MSGSHRYVAQDIERAAVTAAETYSQLIKRPLDFSEASIARIDEVLDRLVAFQLSQQQATIVAQDLGCYVLAVAKRAHGGRYAWVDSWNEPVLVVGEPAFELALATWGKARGRLGGDPADCMAFLYKGFVERLRMALPGTRATYA